MAKHFLTTLFSPETHRITNVEIVFFQRTALLGVFRNRMRFDLRFAHLAFLMPTARVGNRYATTRDRESPEEVANQNSFKKTHCITTHLSQFNNKIKTFDSKAIALLPELHFTISKQFFKVKNMVKASSIKATSELTFGDR